MLLIVLAAHILGAIGVGVIFLVPFLADQPVAAQRALLVLRVSATFTAVTGSLLWLFVRPGGHYVALSLILLAVVVIAVGTRIAPAIERASGNPVVRRRLRIESALVAGATAVIAVLMVTKP
jgi:hypothetical protein